MKKIKMNYKGHLTNLKDGAKFKHEDYPDMVLVKLKEIDHGTHVIVHCESKTGESVDFNDMCIHEIEIL